MEHQNLTLCTRANRYRMISALAVVFAPLSSMAKRLSLADNRLAISTMKRLAMNYSSEDMTLIRINASSHHHIRNSIRILIDFYQNVAKPLTAISQDGEKRLFVFFYHHLALVIASFCFLLQIMLCIVIHCCDLKLIIFICLCHLFSEFEPHFISF